MRISPKFMYYSLQMSRYRYIIVTGFGYKYIFFYWLVITMYIIYNNMRRIKKPINISLYSNATIKSTKKYEGWTAQKKKQQKALKREERFSSQNIHEKKKKTETEHFCAASKFFEIKKNLQNISSFLLLQQYKNVSVIYFFFLVFISLLRVYNNIIASFTIWIKLYVVLDGYVLKFCRKHKNNR